MKIECPECNATLFLDEFPNFPVKHVCDECGACFEVESHLVFDEKSSGTDGEIRVPLGE